MTIHITSNWYQRMIPLLLFSQRDLQRMETLSYLGIQYRLLIQDVSKQIVSASVAHMLNLIVAIFLSLGNDTDQCIKIVTMPLFSLYCAMAFIRMVSIGFVRYERPKSELKLKFYKIILNGMVLKTQWGHFLTKGLYDPRLLCYISRY